MSRRPPISSISIGADGKAQERHVKFNDVDLASWFAADYKGLLIYDHTFQNWRMWDSRRWVIDERGYSQEAVKNMLFTLRDNAQLITDKQKKQEMISSVERAMSIPKIKNVLKAASSLPEMSATVDDFDIDPYILNLQNGTLDLKTLELRPHSPLDRLTMVADAAYNPEAECPRWDMVMQRSFESNPEIIVYLETVFGYAMSGLNIEKRFWIMQGKGDTGKTTIINAVSSVLGDYFRTADWSTFAAGKNDNEQRHRTDLVSLVGGRLISASEGNQGVKLSEGTIKKVTGRSVMKIRDLNSKPFAIEPAWKIILDTNHLPPLRAADDAIWIRVVLIPFLHSIPIEEQIAFRTMFGDLVEILRSERDGIFNRLLQGWRNYLQFGLKAPESVKSAVDMYRRREDTFGEFLEEMCEHGPSMKISKSLLHNAYLAWAKRRAEYDMSAKKFHECMVERGFEEHRTAGGRYWLGLQLDANVIANASSLPEAF